MRVLVHLLWVLAGCGSCTVGLPHYDNANRMTLRVINDRSSSIKLVTQFGDHAPFEIVARDGEPRFVIGTGSENVPSGNCACRCGYACDDCEPPPYSEVVLAPSESFDFSWSGRVQHNRDGLLGGRCFDPYAGPTGPRTFIACLDDLSVEDRDCISVDAELPTEMIEFRFQSNADAGAAPAAED